MSYKNFSWYVSITLLVASAMFIAQVPAVVAGVIMWLGVWTGFVESSPLKMRGGK